MEKDQRAETYYEFYRSHLEGRQHQHGGSSGADFPVFRGTRYIQYGQGFGSIFQKILRYGLPILAKGAQTFFNEFTRGRDEGSNWKEAAKSSLMPTMKAAMGETGEQLRKAATAAPSSSLTSSSSGQQEGSGRKRKSPARKGSKRGDYKAPRLRLLSPSRISSQNKNLNYNF